MNACSKHISTNASPRQSLLYTKLAWQKGEGGTFSCVYRLAAVTEIISADVLDLRRGSERTESLRGVGHLSRGRGKGVCVGGGGVS